MRLKSLWKVIDLGLLHQIRKDIKRLFIRTVKMATNTETNTNQNSAWLKFLMLRRNQKHRLQKVILNFWIKMRMISIKIYTAISHLNQSRSIKHLTKMVDFKHLTFRLMMSNRRMLAHNLIQIKVAFSSSKLPNATNLPKNSRLISWNKCKNVNSINMSSQESKTATPILKKKILMIWNHKSRKVTMSTCSPSMKSNACKILKESMIHRRRMMIACTQFLYIPWVSNKTNPKSPFRTKASMALSSAALVAH